MIVLVSKIAFKNFKKLIIDIYYKETMLINIRTVQHVLEIGIFKQ